MDRHPLYEYLLARADYGRVGAKRSLELTEEQLRYLAKLVEENMDAKTQEATRP